MEYTYSFRIYPNEEQILLIAKTFGCCRFIYNYFLDYSNSNGYSSKYTNNNICNRELKTEYPWLKEVDKFAITNAIYNLDNAYKRYMNKLGGMPKFKKKNKGESYQTNYTNNNIEVLDNYIKLPKLGKVFAKVYRKVEGTIINATIKKYSNNKYKVMILVRKKIKKLETNSYIVGIDMGVADLAITSDSKKYPKFESNWYEQQANKAQSRFSKRKQRALVRVRQWNHNHRDIKQELEDYSNWQKARVAKSRYQAKIANKRKDYLHKITTELVKSYDVIVIEDLKTKNLLKNHHLAKSITNNSWYLFREMLEYKCKWYGKQLIVVKPNYTSQICSNCGYHSGKKPLDVREWTCPKCNTHHDRDINASINILNRGLKELRKLKKIKVRD